MLEECKFCGYKFKESDQVSKRCPNCCGIRDVYSNIAHKKGIPREQAKARHLVDVYGIHRKFSKERLRELFSDITGDK